MCWSRKPVYRKVSRVQIPLSAPRKEIVGLLARFFLQKNTSLFRPQFPLYRPNAKLAKQFRSVLSCEVDASKKSFVGNVLLLGFELSVKKVASGKFFSASVKASIDPRSVACEAEQIPLSAPRKKRECVSSLSFFSAYVFIIKNLLFIYLFYNNYKNLIFDIKI